MNMGAGNRIFEQDLLKIRIILLCNPFTSNMGEEEKKLLIMIDSYFHENTKSTSKLHAISEYLQQIKENGADLLDLVKDWTIEAEENGRAHRIKAKDGSTMVWPDP
jgi:hypothetical protein